jgi:hypothetical protein
MALSGPQASTSVPRFEISRIGDHVLPECYSGRTTLEVPEMSTPRVGQQGGIAAAIRGMVADRRQALKLGVFVFTSVERDDRHWHSSTASHAQSRIPHLGRLKDVGFLDESEPRTRRPLGSAPTESRCHVLHDALQGVSVVFNA